ncbi:aminopeptidase N [Burkholderia sp. LMU1-1-1.1]|uniref:aminopeptidase N n=1 Tax=Burkholderia sp. LMU1-1-1.1 TaxID=3135266 RepID=UPI00341C286E
MKKSLIVLALLLAYGTTAVALTPVAPTHPRAENAYLSQEDAAARSARVSNVDYTLEFALTGKETFSGSTTLAFDLKDATQALTIDLDKATIASLTVNGKAVTPQYNQWFITLAPQDLKAGRNTVAIAYTRLHSTNGEGLHRMVDPVDGRVYTYSHFEPAAAHQMFALFDQPDLKGTFQVTVSTPADWVVSSTMRESGVTEVDGGKRWTFPRSKKLSPYNFSMHAGPYKVWEDNSGPYPMRLFARQSVAAQVSPKDWFGYTSRGLKFFDQYFGVPYQFEKYDQLLVPDFLYGAMENAAAITFAERAFLHQDEMTAAQRESLAGVIMHEMAHQWFGDLVTMKWWNGLWLNESFASFMGTLATAEATEFTHAWQSFYSDDKQKAYTQDQRVTTHPIETPVPSTANAFDNIDAITYSKGASTLKQLRHLLGEEVFRQGVHNYLVKYSYQNAKLDDFIGSLAQAANRDLGPWTREWLYEPGVNTIAAEFSCAGGKIKSFSLHQNAPSAAMPTLREQRVQIGLFNLGKDGMSLSKNLAVTYKGAATAVPELKGVACPDLAYPNYQDWGYAKVQLDKKSFATAQSGLNKVADPLLRSMLWQSLWDSVRDAKLPLNAFLATVLTNAPGEKDYTLLGDILAKVGQSRAYLDKMGPQAAAYRAKAGGQLEQMAFTAASAASADKNFQRLWFSTFVALASSQTALAQLADILAGKLVVPGLNVSQDVRWDIVNRLNRFAYPGSEALLAAEQERDKSDSGQAAALAARVIRPDAKVKAEWLANIGDLQTKLPFSKIRQAMQVMYPADQGALNELSAEQRLATLGQVDKAAGPVFMRSYAEAMIPATCTPASVSRLQAAIVKLPDLSTGTKRSLLVRHQEDERCVAIKKAMTVF